MERQFVAFENGVPTPRVYKDSQGKILSSIGVSGADFYVGLMDYINAKDFFSLGERPSKEDLGQLVDVADKIRKIDYKPDFIYDSWALSSFIGQFDKKRGRLDAGALEAIRPIADMFRKFDYDGLPKAFCHADMHAANLIKDGAGKVWVIDWGVSNYMARVSELIVLLSGVWQPVDDGESVSRSEFVIKKWCDKVGATQAEVSAIEPLLMVKAAIRVMNPSYEIEANGDKSAEMLAFRNSGYNGLRLIPKIMSAVSR